MADFEFWCPLVERNPSFPSSVVRNIFLLDLLVMPMILEDSLWRELPILSSIMFLILKSVVGPIGAFPGGVNIPSNSRSNSSSFVSCFIIFFPFSMIFEFFFEISELISFPRQVDENVAKKTGLWSVDVVWRSSIFFGSFVGSDSDVSRLDFKISEF